MQMRSLLQDQAQLEIGAKTNILKSVPFQPELPKIFVSATNPAQPCPSFRLDLNTRPF